MAAPKFTEQEREQQRNEVLDYWMQGLTVRQIAQELSESCGVTVSHDTAWRRLKEAKEAMRPTVDFDVYVLDAMAELEVCRRKVRCAIGAFEPGDSVGDLARACRTLVELQGQVHKLTGVDVLEPELLRMRKMSPQELEEFTAEILLKHGNVGARR